jgi:glutaminyl-tRNA synthetase
LLIEKGKAYICEMTAQEISENRGTPIEPGMKSPWRNRPVKESLQIFREMREGKHADGTYLLRAKIDMASPNMHMRDPVMYRIRHAHHHRTGDKWYIYPMYDWAHGQSDYIEGITHSLCTLEFEVHRELYDWYLDQLTEPGAYRPKQREFARLNLSYTVMSKRKLQQLVEEKLVDCWDDPRMPTISGLRRRGYTPESIKLFVEKIGVAKRENLIDVSLLEFCIREDLNKKAPRVMAVLNPLKVIIQDYPDALIEQMDAENNPEDPGMGSRKLPFSKTLYIEREDFMEDPPKKFFRLGPGREVRLKNAYIIKCQEIIKNDKGEVVELHCSYDPESRSGMPGSSRKVKGTLHWVSAEHAINAEVRLYDRLFISENPDNAPQGKTFIDNLNPDSLKVLSAKIEPNLKDAKPGDSMQFQRLGYFCVDKDSRPEKLVFNRTVTLRDTWAKMAGK